jgi:hypothetical protein
MLPSASLTHLQGDVLQVVSQPSNKGIIIPHISNDVGKWGKGFTAALDRCGPQPKRDYMKLWAEHRAAGRMPRGLSVLTKVETILDQRRPYGPGCFYVFTMVVQAGCGRGLDRVDYVELERCLRHLRGTLETAAASANRPLTDYEVHMPRIGTGYAGGNWGVIEPIIRQTLVAGGFNVFVYEL